MSLFSRENVLGTLEVSSQDDVFKALAERAVSLGIAQDVASIVADYQEREQEASTGFGGGIAIPHAKTSDVSEATVLFARLATPVEWHAIDDEPVDTVISLLVPFGANSEHLKLLSSLSRQLVHADFVQMLKTATDDEIYENISSVLTKS